MGFDWEYGEEDMPIPDPVMLASPDNKELPVVLPVVELAGSAAAAVMSQQTGIIVKKKPANETMEISDKIFDLFTRTSFHEKLVRGQRYEVMGNG